jgi:hypothetical protein
MIALAALAVLAAAAALFLRGCNSPPTDSQADGSAAAAPGAAAASAGFAPAVSPPAAPQPTPEQSARKGQIYFHRNVSLSKIITGEGIVTPLADLAEKGLVPYQVHSARLSPDATRMAYGNAVTRPVGNGLFGSFPPEAIFVRKVATSEPGDKVVELKGSEIHEFFWSPDSTQVAFTSWDKDKEIRNWVVDVATKEVHELKLPHRHAPDGREYSLAIAAWSPDRNKFAAGDEAFLYLVEMNTTGANWSWSGRGRLTKEPHQILGGTCSFSPDGRKALFVAVDEGVRMSLLTAEVGGNKDQVLVAPGGFTDLYGCWSPEGKRIAFSGAHLDAAGKRAGQSGIYILDASAIDARPAPVLEEFHPPEQFRLKLVDWR